MRRTTMAPHAQAEAVTRRRLQHERDSAVALAIWLRTELRKAKRELAAARRRLRDVNQES